MVGSKVELNTNAVAILTAVADFPITAGPISYTELNYIADTAVYQNADDEYLIHWAIQMKDTLYKEIDYQAVLSVDHSDDPQCIAGSDCEDITSFHFTVNCLDCDSAPEDMGWASADIMEQDSDYESPDGDALFDTDEDACVIFDSVTLSNVAVDCEIADL